MHIIVKLHAITPGILNSDSLKVQVMVRAVRPKVVTIGNGDFILIFIPLWSDPRHRRLAFKHSRALSRDVKVMQLSNQLHREFWEIKQLWRFTILQGISGN